MTHSDYSKFWHTACRLLGHKFTGKSIFFKEKMLTDNGRDITPIIETCSRCHFARLNLQFGSGWTIPLIQSDGKHTVLFEFLNLHSIVSLHLYSYLTPFDIMFHPHLSDAELAKIQTLVSIGNKIVIAYLFTYIQLKLLNSGDLKHDYVTGEVGLFKQAFKTLSSCQALRRLYDEFHEFLQKNLERDYFQSLSFLAQIVRFQTMLNQLLEEHSVCVESQNEAIQYNQTLDDKTYELL